MVEYSDIKEVNMRIKTLVGALIAATIVTLVFASPLGANSSSTTLAFEPEIVRVPHLDLEQGLGRFYIDLRLSNVQDLKWFKFTIVFDGDILIVPEWWEGGRPEPSRWSGGGRSSSYPSYGSYTYEHYDLINPISGSGVLLKFLFETRAAGTTKIEFREAELRDSNGDVIPCTFIGNEVEVISFEAWVDGEYAELKVEFDDLQEDYSLLQSTYDGLNAAYGELQSDHDRLKQDYGSLESTYEELISDHDKLQSDYDGLESELESAVNLLETKLHELDLQKKLLYGFVGVTVVLVAAVGYLLRRRAKSQ